jgi:hypothetical protein
MDEGLYALRLCWYITFLHAGNVFRHGIEECKITAWARDYMPLAYVGILHSSMPEMSEEVLIFFILCHIHQEAVV